MVFHWSLSDSKSPQVSRSLLNILAVLNNVAVWMVSTGPPTYKSSSPFSNPLVPVPNAPITIGIIVTCTFDSFFQFTSKRRGAGLCIYHLFAWSKLNFLHISQWITLPTQSCLVLYSFCADLQHSLSM